ncbi:MAG: DUF2157 domain-containing protein [Elusimicrobiota bacterium]|jgi:uncharacterized membrane protein|nr:DUF2157 domain-containing protein [Elusimicrobiota bacterium]
MNKNIKEWIEAGIITSQQAEKMQYLDSNQPEPSRKVFPIIAFCILALIVTGVFYLIISNWGILPYGARISILICLFFISSLLGYHFKFNTSRSKLSALFFFLSILFFGGLIFAVANFYALEPNSAFHFLILIWIIAIIPYAYIFKSQVVALLASILFIIWFSVFVIATDNFIYVSKQILPFAYYILGLFFLCFGKINEFSRYSLPAAKVFQRTGLFIICLSAFFMTFDFFTVANGKVIFDIIIINSFISINVKLTNIIVIVLSAMFLISFFANPAKENHILESVLTAVLIISCIFISSTAFIALIVINSLFVFIVLSLAIIGYRKKDLFYINIAMAWLLIFALSKYVSLCIDMFPLHFFFMIGGAILILFVFLFENRRRRFTKSFANQNEFPLMQNYD